MKKRLGLIYLLCLIFLLNISYGQISPDSKTKISTIDIRNKLLKIYADSLINFKSGDKLPVFLFSEKFDYTCNIPLRNRHSIESLRRFVLLEIKDEEVFEKILFALSKSDKKNIKPDVARIPFSKYSFYELIKIRLEELNNNEGRPVSTDMKR